MPKHRFPITCAIAWGMIPLDTKHVSAVRKELKQIYYSLKPRHDHNGDYVLLMPRGNPPKRGKRKRMAACGSFFEVCRWIAENQPPTPRGKHDNPERP
jgi:hypothetical protein